MKRLLIIAILLSGFSLVDAREQVSWKELQTNIQDWSKGPVRLLLTDEEKDVFAKLKTPEEKLQFIKIFWARRDAVLRTRTNEFKQEFYKRVDHANANFAEKNTPGWETARGQAYILFGAPSRVDHQSVPDSSRPALLWVYDNLPAKNIPRNEALMFVWHDFKYVLAPPNPNEGDRIEGQQASMDRSFRYQSIPTAVQQAFVEVSDASIADKDKDYEDLLFSVRTTEKFGIAQINFETSKLQSQPLQLEVSIPAETAPVYDEGNRTFAELVFIVEVKQGDRVISRKEHTESFTWNPDAFDDLDQIQVKLPAVEVPAGDYDLFVTVQDRISSVSETKKVS